MTVRTFRSLQFYLVLTQTSRSILTHFYVFLRILTSINYEWWKDCYRRLTRRQNIFTEIYPNLQLQRVLVIDAITSFRLFILFSGKFQWLSLLSSWKCMRNRFEITNKKIWIYSNHLLVGIWSEYQSGCSNPFHNIAISAQYKISLKTSVPEHRRLQHYFRVPQIKTWKFYFFTFW